MQYYSLVSIIVPNFNHASFLQKRIDSILAQTFQNFELILLDDASSDDSLVIFEKYKTHPKVAAYIINVKNSGSPFGMWSKGISLAKGDLIWIAESDDWASPVFLEKLVSAFADPKVVVSHSRSYDVDSFGNGKSKNTWWDSFNLKIWEADYIMDGKTLLDSYGKYKCPVVNVSSALIRKSVLNKVEIPDTYKYCGDWLFWGKLFQLGKVFYAAEPLNYIRNHSNSATGKNKSNNLDRILENFKVVKIISNDLNQKLQYHNNYFWLLQFLMQETLKNRNYLKFAYLSPKIPFSFKWIFYKRLISVLFQKTINMISK